MADLPINPNLSLPLTFNFTQSNLQDFKDCARRFYLKYIANQHWPSLLNSSQEDFEKAMKQGERFHRLAQRHQLGIPLNTLTPSVADDLEITSWLNKYQHILQKLGQFDQVWPEVSLSSKLGHSSILAKFDLIGLQSDHILAIDWKTGPLPTNQRLTQRMQTIVYLYILYHQAQSLTPHKINHYSLVYASVDKGSISRFDATLQTITQATQALQATLADIQQATQKSQFDKVSDAHFCRFCYYRGLCERELTSPITLEEFKSEDYSLPDLEEINQYTVEF